MEWVQKDVLKDNEHPALAIIEKTHRELQGVAVNEAVSGWCPIDGCPQKFKQFMIGIFFLSLFASTGRVGNLLVALRCVELRDKALSMAFQVVFMSVLAMLPSPIVYGAIIDKSCLLWQQECGETTNCLLYDTDALRKVLMLTTAAIASLGVLCDVAVWYYSKDLKIFYNEPVSLSSENGLKNVEGADENDLVTLRASTITLTKDHNLK